MLKVISSVLLQKERRLILKFELFRKVRQFLSAVSYLHLFLGAAEQRSQTGSGGHEHDEVERGYLGAVDTCRIHK